MSAERADRPDAAEWLGFLYVSYGFKPQQGTWPYPVTVRAWGELTEFEPPEGGDSAFDISITLLIDPLQRVARVALKADFIQRGTWNVWVKGEPGDAIGPLSARSPGIAYIGLEPDETLLKESSSTESD